MQKKVINRVKNNGSDLCLTDEIQKNTDKKGMYIRIMNEILTELKISANELGNLLGKKRSQSIYDILDPNKKVGISLNMADRICEKFPQFNKCYLLTGEGEMLKTTINQENGEMLRNENLDPQQAVTYKELYEQSKEEIYRLHEQIGRLKAENEQKITSENQSVTRN
jgi:hypothetical protein